MEHHFPNNIIARDIGRGLARAHLTINQSVAIPMALVVDNQSAAPSTTPLTTSEVGPNCVIMPNLCSQLYRGRDMDIAPHRTVARNAAIAAGMRCSQKVLSSEDYTLDQAISVAVREKWRVIVYAPRGKRGGVNYYLKGKDMSEEDATIEIMAHPRGQRSTRNGKCVFVLEW